MNKHFFSHTDSKATRVNVTIQNEGISVTLNLNRTQQRELFFKLARQMGRAELAMAYSQVLTERLLEEEE